MGDAMRQAPKAGARQWKWHPRRDRSPGGPNYTKGIITLQIGHNKIVSLLPYQDVQSLKDKYIECNVQILISRGTIIKELTLQVNNNP